MFQSIRGFHVEIEGLDTLSPPDISVKSEAPDGGVEARAWTEARALCDEAFYSLIDALIAAETPGPDHFGDDLISDGRVIGMMEFGWSTAGVAVAEEAHEAVGWSLITFDSDTDAVGETVTKVLQALEEARS